MSLEGLPTFPMPTIFPFEPSPKVTLPPSFLALRDENKVASPVICLEHPLSKTHWLEVPLAFKHTYQANQGTLGTQTLGPWGLENMKS